MASENVVPFSRPASGPDEEPTRSRAVALFTFLKELTELRGKTVRTVDQYPEVRSDPSSVDTELSLQ